MTPMRLSLTDSDTAGPSLLETLASGTTPQPAATGSVSGNEGARGRFARCLDPDVTVVVAFH